MTLWRGRSRRPFRGRRGRLGGVQDGRREGSLHGEHGAPMERVPWITASIKGLTVTGLKTGLGADKRAADGRREYSRKRASPRLDGLDGGVEETWEAWQAWQA